MEPAFKHILIAVDLTEDARAVAQKACALRTAFDATLSCTHVIEPLSLAYGGDVPMDLSTIQDQLQETAKIQLDEFAEGLDIPSENRHLVYGRPETEIHSLAEELEVDLIVVGSHGRHGLALLLGSTANGVLQGSPCDVLAVRVGD
ncbi:MAG: universal stress protein A [Candidatus Azotimanducaceae bacterium]|jgi:universal stress protein A|tara:strand:+ start:630 stop:1067 length:438 start_codon:yes stop_codon:yes gene_type:complete